MSDDGGAFARLEVLFHAAQGVPAGERDAWVVSACGGDAALERELRELLAAADGARLEAPAPTVVAGWLGARPPPAAGPADEGAGRRVGSCRLVRRLGSGGMGVVWEGVQEPPGRAVAVKLLRAAFDDADARARFEREARIVGSLRHPGVAAVYEAGTHDADGERVPYLVMELVPDARTVLEHARAARLSREGCLELFARVADAVEAAHQRGVIHRDLKPANILVGADGAPKVIDFGIARERDGGAGAATRTGHVVGTLAYMGPERFEAGAAGDDVRTDVYALGVVLHELLVGRPPHAVDGRPLWDVVRALRDTAPVPLDRVDPSVGADVAAVVGKALARAPEDRYASAGALAADVRRVLAHEPVLARPPGLLHALGLLARRRRAAFAAAAVAVVALVAATAVSLWFAAGERTARTAADRQRARAEELLRQTKDFAPWVLGDLHRALLDVPGSTRARRVLAEGVQRHLDRIAVTEGDDPGLADAVIRAYALLGGVLESLGGRDPGLRARADAALSRARSLAASRFASAPGDASAARTDARASLSTAMVLVERGDVDAAEPLVDAALARLEGVGDDPAGETTLLRREAHGARGAIAAYRSRWRDALREEQALADELDADPDAATPRGIAARLRVRLRVTRALAALGDLDASARAAEGLAPLVAALTPSADEAPALDALLLAAIEVGDAELSAGRPEAALAHFRRAADLADRWRAADPLALLPWRHAGVAASRRGTALERLRRPADAIAAYDLAIAASDAVLARAPDDDREGWNALVARTRRAACLVLAGRHADAEPAVADAEARARARLAAHPDDPPTRTAAADVDSIAAMFAVARNGPDTPPETMLARAREALDRLERAAAVYAALRAAGTVPADRAAEPDRIARQLDLARRLVDALEAPK